MGEKGEVPGLIDIKTFDVKQIDDNFNILKGERERENDDVDELIAIYDKIKNTLTEDKPEEWNVETQADIDEMAEEKRTKSKQEEELWEADQEKKRENFRDLINGLDQDAKILLSVLVHRKEDNRLVKAWNKFYKRIDEWENKKSDNRPSNPAENTKPHKKFNPRTIVASIIKGAPLTTIATFVSLGVKGAMGLGGAPTMVLGATAGFVTGLGRGIYNETKRQFSPEGWIKDIWGENYQQAVLSKTAEEIAEEIMRQDEGGVSNLNRAKLEQSLNFLNNAAEIERGKNGMVKDKDQSLLTFAIFYKRLADAYNIINRNATKTEAINSESDADRKKELEKEEVERLQKVLQELLVDADKNSKFKELHKNKKWLVATNAIKSGAFGAMVGSGMAGIAWLWDNSEFGEAINEKFYHAFGHYIDWFHIHQDHGSVAAQTTVDKPAIDTADYQEDLNKYNNLIKHLDSEIKSGASSSTDSAPGSENNQSDPLVKPVESGPGTGSGEGGNNSGAKEASIVTEKPTVEARADAPVIVGVANDSVSLPKIPLAPHLAHNIVVDVDNGDIPDSEIPVKEPIQIPAPLPEVDPQNIVVDVDNGDIPDPEILLPDQLDEIPTQADNIPVDNPVQTPASLPDGYVVAPEVQAETPQIDQDAVVGVDNVGIPAPEIQPNPQVGEVVIEPSVTPQIDQSTIVGVGNVDIPDPEIQPTPQPEIVPIDPLPNIDPDFNDAPFMDSAGPADTIKSAGEAVVEEGVKQNIIPGELPVAEDKAASGIFQSAINRQDVYNIPVTPPGPVETIRYTGGAAGIDSSGGSETVVNTGQANTSETPVTPSKAPGTTVLTPKPPIIPKAPEDVTPALSNEKDPAGNTTGGNKPANLGHRHDNVTIPGIKKVAEAAEPGAKPASNEPSAYEKAKAYVDSQKPGTDARPKPETEIRLDSGKRLELKQDGVERIMRDLLRPDKVDNLKTDLETYGIKLSPQQIAELSKHTAEFTLQETALREAKTALIDKGVEFDEDGKVLPETISNANQESVAQFATQQERADVKKTALITSILATLGLMSAGIAEVFLKSNIEDIRDKIEKVSTVEYKNDDEWKKFCEAHKNAPFEAIYTPGKSADSNVIKYSDKPGESITSKIEDGRFENRLKLPNTQRKVTFGINKEDKLFVVTEVIKHFDQGQDWVYENKGFVKENSQDFAEALRAKMDGKKEIVIRTKDDTYGEKWKEERTREFIVVSYDDATNMLHCKLPYIDDDQRFQLTPSNTFNDENSVWLVRDSTDEDIEEFANHPPVVDIDTNEFLDDDGWKKFCDDHRNSPFPAIFENTTPKTIDYSDIPGVSSKTKTEDKRFDNLLNLPLESRFVSFKISVDNKLVVDTEEVIDFADNADEATFENKGFAKASADTLMQALPDINAGLKNVIIRTADKTFKSFDKAVKGTCEYKVERYDNYNGQLSCTYYDRINQLQRVELKLEDICSAENNFVWLVQDKKAVPIVQKKSHIDPPLTSSDLLGDKKEESKAKVVELEAAIESERKNLTTATDPDEKIKIQENIDSLTKELDALKAEKDAAKEARRAEIEALISSDETILDDNVVQMSPIEGSPIERFKYFHPEAEEFLRKNNGEYFDADYIPPYIILPCRLNIKDNIDPNKEHRLDLEESNFEPGYIRPREKRSLFFHVDGTVLNVKSEFVGNKLCAVKTINLSEAIGNGVGWENALNTKNNDFILRFPSDKKGADNALGEYTVDKVEKDIVYCSYNDKAGAQKKREFTLNQLDFPIVRLTADKTMAVPEVIQEEAGNVASPEVSNIVYSSMVGREEDYIPLILDELKHVDGETTENRVIKDEINSISSKISDLLEMGPRAGDPFRFLNGKDGNMFVEGVDRFIYAFKGKDFDIATAVEGMEKMIRNYSYSHAEMSKNPKITETLSGLYNALEELIQSIGKEDKYSELKQSITTFAVQIRSDYE